MTNETEAVADIVREMRSFAMSSTATGSQCRRNIYVYADKIESAHRREIGSIAAPTPDQWTEIARQGSELADLQHENERLREALQPVLDCPTACPGQGKAAVPNYAACYDAIKAALEILNGETK